MPTAVKTDTKSGGEAIIVRAGDEIEPDEEFLADGNEVKEEIGERMIEKFESSGYIMKMTVEVTPSGTIKISGV